MRRRRFLASGVTALLVGGAGHAGPFAGDDPASGDDSTPEDGWSPGVRGPDPELAPGTETTLSVEATDVAGVFFSAVPDPVDLDFGAADLDPSPASTYLMHPPAWTWGTRTAVAVDVPLAVADGAAAGEYRYEVTVFDEFPDGGVEVRTAGEAAGGDPDGGLRSTAAAFPITVE